MTTPKPLPEEIQELLRLTTDLPEWAIRGDPEPGSPEAMDKGCRCIAHSGLHPRGTRWSVYRLCVVHVKNTSDSGWHTARRVNHIRDTIASFKE